MTIDEIMKNDSFSKEHIQALYENDVSRNMVIMVDHDEIIDGQTVTVFE